VAVMVKLYVWSTMPS